MENITYVSDASEEVWDPLEANFCSDFCIFMGYKELFCSLPYLFSLPLCFPIPLTALDFT